MPSGLWLFAAGAFAAGQIAWLIALDKVIDAPLRRIVGRVLRIRVEAVQSRAGPFAVRSWSTPPPNREKRPLVAISGALIVLVTTALPTILLFMIVPYIALSPRVSATLTLMAVFSYPIIVAARLVTSTSKDS